ncbi:hypothetical protein QDZ90_005432 [Pluralibacter gergoviae]|nr:hypothetical protein [Klebsiella pneumoniae]
MDANSLDAAAGCPAGGVVMRTIEELGKRAALLKWKRQFGPFEKCPVCYGILTGCKLCGGNGRVIQEDIDAWKNNIKNKF